MSKVGRILQYVGVGVAVARVLLGGSRAQPRAHTHIWQRWTPDGTGGIIALDHDVCALCGIRK